MEDESKWKGRLNWLNCGELLHLEFRRVSWIKLVRLKFKLWGENNFEQITWKFGEMIVLFDEIYHRIDLSCAKIGILTDRCTKINE